MPLCSIMPHSVPLGTRVWKALDPASPVSAHLVRVPSEGVLELKVPPYGSSRQAESLEKDCDSPLFLYSVRSPWCPFLLWSRFGDGGGGGYTILLRLSSRPSPIQSRRTSEGRSSWLIKVCIPLSAEKLVSHPFFIFPPSVVVRGGGKKDLGGVKSATISARGCLGALEQPRTRRRLNSSDPRGEEEEGWSE